MSVKNNKDGHGQKARLETLSFDEIDDILTRTTDARKEGKFGQRNQAQSHINFLVEEMRTGRWKVNGVPVILSKEKYVIDGQHRLWAAWTLERPLRTWVVRGADKSIIDSIDVNNKPRSLGDLLNIKGESGTLATALRLLHRYRKGLIFWRSGRAKLSGPEMFNLLKREPAIRNSLRVAQPLRDVVKHRGAMVFSHYLFSQNHPRLADTFFEGLSTGVGLQTGDPVLVLRNKLQQQRPVGQSLQGLEVLYLTFKAWLYTLAGEVLPRNWAHWRRGGDAPEDFPYLEDFVANTTRRKSAARRSVKREKARAAKRMDKRVEEKAEKAKRDALMRAIKKQSEDKKKKVKKKTKKKKAKAKKK